MVVGGGEYKCGGHNLPPLVEIGLTDLQKSGGAIGNPGDDRPVLHILNV